MEQTGFFEHLTGGNRCAPVSPRRMLWTAASALALASAQPALSQEIHGKCGQAVGTFLTTNQLDDNAKIGTSRSLLVLTNGGHVLRSDSDEIAAAMDHRAFGDSAGRWRCDGVSDDGTVRLTMVTLNFTYPASKSEKAQIARIDLSGGYSPKTETLELKGELVFLPMTAAANDDAVLATQELRRIATSVRAKKIQVPQKR